MLLSKVTEYSMELVSQRTQVMRKVVRRQSLVVHTRSAGLGAMGFSL